MLFPCSLSVRFSVPMEQYPAERVAVDGGGGGDGERERVFSIFMFFLFFNEVNAEWMAMVSRSGSGRGVGGEGVDEEAVHFERESAEQVVFGTVSGDELRTADRVEVEEVDDEHAERGQPELVRVQFAAEYVEREQVLCGPIADAVAVRVCQGVVQRAYSVQCRFVDRGRGRRSMSMSLSLSIEVALQFLV